jgi:ferric-dicitrate binding protein FerR (iron transport regulator)
MQVTLLEILLDKNKKGTLTGAEVQQLSRMIGSPEYQQELEMLIDKGFADPGLKELGDPETRELIYQEVLLRKDGLAGREEMAPDQVDGAWGQAGRPLADGGTAVIRPGVFRRRWWLGAAAVLFILLGAGVIFLIFKKKGGQHIAALPSQEQRYRNDVAPGGNKAILTLGNGSTIVLDSAQNGLLTRQGNSKVMKLANGELAYTSVASGNVEVLYNTVSTPRGGQYKLRLPDGSLIWLNAASSIRYPTSFTGNERRVEISGEAYFEIAGNAARPFKVKIISASGDGGEVDVLGTHFNINAYNDETVIKTTLLNGSVRVTVGKATSLLKPGEQAQVGPSNGLKLIKEADPDEAVAWMNGVFKFRQATIAPLMRAIARWYDVEVNYEGNIASHFTITIPRDITVTNVFKILEQTGEVHFKIDGRRVTVMQ